MAGAAVSDTRTVVVEIKYFCTKNVVIHTENCLLDLPLDCSTTQMEKNIEECVAKRNRVDEEDLQISLSKCFTSTSLKREVHNKPPSS